MKTAAILSCALALSPVSFDGESKVDTIKALREFVKQHYPRAEMVIIPSEQPPPSIEWEQVPLTWGGMQLWIKRPIVYDKRRPGHVYGRNA